MKKLVAGIDIGGNYTACALVDEWGKIYASTKFKTADFPTFNSFVQQIHKSIVLLEQEIEDSHILEVIGIGAPNGNYYTGEIENPTNLKWKGRLPLAGTLSNLFNGIKVIVTNDANAAAIGEMMYGGAKGMKNFVSLTLDAGLGCGIVIDGNIIYGHDGFAGELGHITILPESQRICGCGRKGCLETYVSVKGIKNTIEELYNSTPDSVKYTNSPLKGIAKEELSTGSIIAAAMQGDALALDAFEATGTVLGMALANMVAILSPQAIVFTGELAQAKELLIKPTRAAMEQNLMPLWRDKIELETSTIDREFAPVLGAAALAIKELQKKYAFFERRKVI